MIDPGHPRLKAVLMRGRRQMPITISAQEGRPLRRVPGPMKPGAVIPPSPRKVGDGTGTGTSSC